MKINSMIAVMIIILNSITHQQKNLIKELMKTKIFL
jgi:hypothetical protein